MNRTVRLLAPASLAISTNCPKVHLQAINHRHLNTVARASLLSPKSSLESWPKYNLMDNLDRKLSSESSDTDSVQAKDDISYAFQNIQVCDSVDENINNLDINLNTDGKKSIKKQCSLEKAKYEDIRQWKKLGKDSAPINSKEAFTLKLLSFNILAQDLLETHSYLYKTHNKQALPWEKRKPLLVQEILEAEAHVREYYITYLGQENEKCLRSHVMTTGDLKHSFLLAKVACLQEMQEEHLRDFLIPFQEHGYTYLYKKRTNDKKDGLLLLYKENLFHLLEFSKVELYQTGIELLSRDNVGLIAKFSLKESPSTKFVIATTHLLYNPRRNDVRLGQVQLLFAEIERISFIENTPVGPRYLPIILSGDFNLEPYSGVYQFITEGSIEFMGKGRNLEKCDNRGLSNSLIPPHLYVTDECQHFNVLSHRLSGKGSSKVMLRNTEDKMTKEKLSPDENLVDKSTTTYQKVEIAEGHFVTFSSGLLTHPFHFHSVYNHKSKGKNEATTFQDKWITVDYIFYNNLEPLEKYTLPTEEECIAFLPTIPNSFVGSDHLCLGATFQLQKR